MAQSGVKDIMMSKTDKLNSWLVWFGKYIND
jgi:hypothetical protein